MIFLCRFKHFACCHHTTCMNKDELPADVDQLRDLVMQLSTTVTQQRETIEKHELKILELLQALRGKQRERIDPDQLLLFEIGELEQIAEEKRKFPRHLGESDAAMVVG